MNEDLIELLLVINKRTDEALSRAEANLDKAITMLEMLTAKRIPVKYDEGENWEFVFVDAGNGKKQMAVF